MATTKPPVPPVNLKDRIAALQQRSVSPTNAASGEPGFAPAPAPGTRVSSLKDKIANFERKGAVPVPRGRFGAGAPPVGDGSTKKKGELYGNRVPELAKPTAEAALLTRKRTVSTSDASTRPDISEEVPPVPAIPETRAPSTGLPATRRIVSDVGPRTSAMDTDGPPSEKPTMEKSCATAVELEAPRDLQEPAAVGTESPTVEETPKETPKFEEPDDVSSTPTNAAEPATAAALLVEEHAVVPEQKPPVTQEVISSSAETLIVNTELDCSSMLGDTTASSESVPTPTTSGSFTTPISSTEDAKRMFAQDLPRVSISGRSTPATPEAASPISATSARGSMAVRQSVISEMSVGSALDAKIVSEPAKVVSPTVTRATIVPASIIRSAPSPPPVSATEDAVLVPQTVQKSTFTAVVHRKVREATASEPARATSAAPAPSPAPQKPTFPPPRTPATQRIRAAIPEEPSSPGLGDLASLMADAALLEEALSSSPAKKQSPSPPPAPEVNVQPVVHAVPEIPQPPQEEPPVAQNITMPQPDVFVATAQPQSPPPAYTPFTSDLSHFASGSTQQPSAHMRSRTTPAPEAPAPQREVPRFSSLRERKQSIPASVYSQAESTESSVFVSRPSSPPSHFNDASSVRSSSKSWKSPKKGIGRASSWFFKGKNKSNPALEEQGARQGASEPSSPSLLMPHPPVPPLPTQILPPTPTSIASAASAASGDVFDLDAFPSVPGGAAAIRPHSMQYPNIAEYVTQQQGQGSARPYTMYAPARK